MEGDLELGLGLLPIGLGLGFRLRVLAYLGFRVLGFEVDSEQIAGFQLKYPKVQMLNPLQPHKMP